MKTSSILKFSLFILILSVGSLKAQVGIGTLNPHPSAELEVYSTARGFLPPVMTTIQRDAIVSPAEGLMVYCSDCSPVGYYLYSNNAWVSLMNTDNQTISRNGLTVTLQNGGSYSDSVLTETEVDAFVADNGYLTSFTEVDGSMTNEIQTLSKSGTTVSLSNGGGSFTDDVLTEAEVDAFAADNGYLTNTIDTDESLSANSNNNIPSQKAVKSYVDLVGGITKTTVGTRNYHFDLNNMANISTGASSNLALGYNALSDITSANHNLAIGFESLPLSTTGSYNVSVGNYSLNKLKTGSYNVAMGYRAGSEVLGSENTLVGHQAGENTTGSGNSFIGSQAGYNSQSNYSVFLGYKAGYNENDDHRLYIENSTGTTPLIGGNFTENKVGINTPIADLSSSSGATLQVGGSISLGDGSYIDGFSTNENLGNSDVLVPTQRAVKNYLDNIIVDLYKVSDDVTLSSGLGRVPTEVAVKTYIDNYPTTGTLNFYGTSLHFGYNNMDNVDVSDATYNLAIGDYALQDLTKGDYNIAIGFKSLHALTTGIHNLAIGVNSLANVTTANNNVALGSHAGFSITGNSNTMVGFYAGYNTTGTQNTFIGRRAGYFSQSNGSIFIGYKAGYYEDNDDRLYIHNSETSQPLIGGSFSHRVVTINQDLDASAFDFTNHASSKDYRLFVNGGAYKSTGGSGWNHHSDKRLKTNIVYMEPKDMLDKVLQMKGVSFEWNDTVTGLERDQGMRHGFIAQDLEQVWPEKVSEGPFGFKVTSYGAYDPMFVESIKALNTKIIDLTNENEQFKAETIRIDQEKDQQIEKINTKLDELEILIKQSQLQIFK